MPGRTFVQDSTDLLAGPASAINSLRRPCSGGQHETQPRTEPGARRSIEARRTPESAGPVLVPAAPTATVFEAFLSPRNHLSYSAAGFVPEVGALYNAAVVPVLVAEMNCRLAIASILDPESTRIRGPFDL
jgi:hypothetical protein